MATLTIADLDNGKRDLQTVSEVANSLADFTPTRFGDSVLTLAGALRLLGYKPPVPYASGLNVDSSLFTVSFGDPAVIYAPDPNLVPFTTGAWNAAQWRAVQTTQNMNLVPRFTSLPAAEAAATTLPDGQLVDVAGTVQKTYEVQSGMLVFQSDLPLGALAKPEGSELVGFEQSGFGSVPRTVFSRLAEQMSLADKGTPADAKTALDNAAVDLATGGELFVPRASWVLPSGFTFAGQRLRLIGEGQNSSIFSFSPASAGSAIKFDNGTSGGVYQGKISGFGFSADAANTVAKTAIELVNCADTEVSHLGIASGSWAGDSIGLRCYGRQTLSLHHSEIACARPIVFSKNTLWPALNTDHFDVFRCELSGLSATRPVIEFENGVALSTTTLRNLAITGGKDGILWNDTTSSAASFGLAIETVRFEQGMDATGWSINLGSTAQTLQTLTIRDVALDSLRNGIRLRNVQRVIIENAAANMTSGVALDMVFVPGSRLSLRNFFQQTGSTITLTNAKCIRRETNTPSVLNEEWIYDDGGEPGAITTDIPTGGVPVSLTNGQSAKIAANSFVGHVDISVSTGVAGTFMLAGANNIAFEIADGAGQFSNVKNTAASVNVYFESGSYYVQNNLGATNKVAVLKRGNVSF